MLYPLSYGGGLPHEFQLSGERFRQGDGDHTSSERFPSPLNGLISTGATGSGRVLLGSREPAVREVCAPLLPRLYS